MRTVQHIQVQSIEPRRARLIGYKYRVYTNQFVLFNDKKKAVQYAAHLSSELTHLVIVFSIRVATAEKLYRELWPYMHVPGEIAECDQHLTAMRSALHRATEPAYHLPIVQFLFTYLENENKLWMVLHERYRCRNLTVGHHHVREMQIEHQGLLQRLEKMCSGEINF